MPAKSSFRFDIPPHVADVIRHLPPDIKRSVRAALQALAANPDLGEPLIRELAGYRKYRVRRFRIVYSLERRQRVIRIVAVGHRRGVYDQATSLVRRERPRK